MSPTKRDPEEQPDLVAELKKLGRQMGETLDVAWNSAENRRMQEQLRAGARAFGEEFERAMGKARTARPAGMASKARRSGVDGLRWMSAELENLANRFTPADDEEDEA